jgi:hypothetical protein
MSEQEKTTAAFEKIVKHYLTSCHEIEQKSVRLEELRKQLESQEQKLHDTDDVSNKQTKTDVNLSLQEVKYKLYNLQNNIPELEIRFGTNPKQAKPISHVDYLHVVDILYAHGWKPVYNNRKGKQILRIIPETLIQQQHNPNMLNEGDGENKTNFYKVVMSKIRAELLDTYLIQDYCNHNDLEKMKDKYSKSQMKFTEKNRIKDTSTEEYFDKLDFSDYNFNVSYQMEKDYTMNSNDARIKSILNDWNNSKKIFRSINRVRFEHSVYPVFVDLSIVKTNRKYKNGKYPLPKTTIQEADVFNTQPVYEVELELNNDKMKFYELNNEGFATLMKEIRQCIRVVLSGLQGTPYPISYTEQENVLQEYMKYTHGEKWSETKKPDPYFIGPNSIALQISNISKERKDIESVPSILKNYTVTEKADGERCLLYITNVGKAYLISYSMKVIFTGSTTKEKECWNSIVDGELIMYDKNRELIFLFAAFDIYYVGGRKKNSNVRNLPFTSYDGTILETRLSILKQFHNVVALTPVAKNISDSCKFHMKVKNFHYYSEIENKSIFNASAKIWNVRETFPYEVDGLIFTPMDYGVGGSKMGETYELNGKFTWKYSFKWKPPKYNTIDFLVTTEKDKDGLDKIHFQVEDNGIVSEYKKLYLMVGFDTRKNNFMYPFDEMLLYKLPPIEDGNSNHNHTSSKYNPTYEVRNFVPTVPYDPHAYICYVKLENDGGNKRMKTEEGQVFDKNMIVEFRYDTTVDNTRANPWRWIPLRIRHDKTQQLLEGKKSMNVYSNANDVWKSIHFPITEQIITGNEVITNNLDATDTIYYSLVEKNVQYTNSLRDFHNLYVKSKLITNVSEYLQKQFNSESILLMDYAVGKAGDLSKWTRGNIQFVFGIDYSDDNIRNINDGACVRYLRYRSINRKDNFRALFMKGNSKLNIRTSGNAVEKQLEKDLIQYVFGQKKHSQPINYSFQYGIAINGFHLSSCQFALHYFFENVHTLHNFIRNLAECTKTDGYFIGTCFDGHSIFRKLSSINHNQSYSIMKDGKLVFEIKKIYNTYISKLETNESSIGLPIVVYQESIGQPIMEYLVNFEYFTQLMKDYGFELIKTEEAHRIGFPSASERFDSLFSSMKSEANKKHLYIRNALAMSDIEKEISFLNRYFIFKKVRELSQSTLNNIQSILLEKSDILEVEPAAAVVVVADGEEKVEDNEEEKDMDEENDVVITEPSKKTKKTQKAQKVQKTQTQKTQKIQPQEQDKNNNNNQTKEIQKLKEKIVLKEKKKTSAKNKDKEDEIISITQPIQE